MINQTPNNLDKFPEPVSGQLIPRGWFGRLVRFINSLILHGDGQYLTVKHTMDGQTIAPTPALLQALGRSGTPPAAGGGGASSFGFPDLSSGQVVALNTVYPLSSPVWLMGTVGLDAASVSDFADIELFVYSSGSTLFSCTLLRLVQSSSAPLVSFRNPVSIPLPAGISFEINVSSSAPLSPLIYDLHMFPIQTI